MVIDDEYETVWAETVVKYLQTDCPILVLNTNRENSPRIVDFRA
jgi:hypothetical protein